MAEGFVSKSQTFQLHFDGGCKPNPGQGYGSYEVLKVKPIHTGATPIPFSIKQTLIQFGFMTNNMAEYHAMIHGLKKLWHESTHGFLYEHGIGPSGIHLEIFSDSRILVEQINHRYRCKVVHLRELKDEARLILKEFGHWKCVWNSRTKNVARFGH